MADDARVWRVYAKAARKHDKERLEQWNGTLDTLLIFAGLFSAVSTTFIIDSYKQMQIDYAKEAFLLQFATTSGTPYVAPSDRIDESARAINCLWISSLIASLSTALIAILAKQWLAFYPVSDRENLREWAQLRQYRFDALERWHVPVLIAVVPVLLHLSLMLFLAGLVVFLWDIDTGTMILAFVLSAATYGLYGFTTLSPVFWSS
ncbi:hypothetical protein EXIGLDRAFT_602548, partial [Exidia glandulosa HHB12029]